MQNQLPVAEAALCQKTFYPDFLPYRKSRQLTGGFGEGDCIYVAQHLPNSSGFTLLRGMTQSQRNTFDAGRGKTRCFQRDQLTTNDNLVACQILTQLRQLRLGPESR